MPTFARLAWQKISDVLAAQGVGENTLADAAARLVYATAKRSELPANAKKRLKRDAKAGTEAAIHSMELLLPDRHGRDEVSLANELAAEALTSLADSWPMRSESRDGSTAVTEADVRTMVAEALAATPAPYVPNADDVRSVAADVATQVFRQMQEQERMPTATAGKEEDSPEPTPPAHAIREMIAEALRARSADEKARRTANEAARYQAQAEQEATVSALRDELAYLKEAAAAPSDEPARRAITDLQQEIAALKARAMPENDNATIAVLRDEVARLKEAAAQPSDEPARAAITAMRKELEVLKKRPPQHEGDDAVLSALRDEIARMKEAAAAASDEPARAAITAMRREIEALKQRPPQQEGDDAVLAALRLEVARLKEAAAEPSDEPARAAITAMQRELETLKTRPRHQEGDGAEIAALRTEIAHLKEAATAASDEPARAAIMAMQETIAGLRREVATLRGSVPLAKPGDTDATELSRLLARERRDKSELLSSKGVLRADYLDDDVELADALATMPHTYVWHKKHADARWPALLRALVAERAMRRTPEEACRRICDHLERKERRLTPEQADALNAAYTEAKQADETALTEFVAVVTGPDWSPTVHDTLRTMLREARRLPANWTPAERAAFAGGTAVHRVTIGGVGFAIKTRKN